MYVAKVVFCLACAELVGPDRLCERCRRSLRRVPRREIGGGLVVAAPFHHSGPARRLVHRLKYESLAQAAHFLAAEMAAFVPSHAEGLIPVPRAPVRRLRYGVDPAVELARALGVVTGLPVLHVLRAALWWPRHALRERAGRRAPRFAARGGADGHMILVDDVVTSGSTLRSAARALGGDVRQGIAATSPGTLVAAAPVDAGEVAWR